MMRFLAGVFVAGALLGAGQASATEEPGAASASQPAPSAMPATPSRNDPNEVICKREQSTESRLGGAKICHTRQEWADMAASARSSVGNAQRSSMTGLIPGH